MHPILFTIGNFSVYTYGAILALAISLGLTFAGYLANKKGYEGIDIADIGLWSTIIGIIGARICYIIQYLDYYLKEPLQMLNFRAGGITIIGAVIFGNLALIMMCRKYKLSPWFCVDIYAAPLLFGMALGRIGCVMQGCCAGKECSPDFPFGLVYPAAAGLGSFPHHPVQIYELLMDLALMAVCLCMLKKAKFEGQTFWTMIAGYGAVRFISEFFRVSRMISVLSLAQWACAAIFIVGLLGVFGVFGRHAFSEPPKKEEAAEAEAAEKKSEA